MTDGSYGINTRYAPKVFEVGDEIVITANGYSADADTLVKRIAQKIEVHNGLNLLVAGANPCHTVVPSRT